MSTKPELIKAGDKRVKLGFLEQPPKVDCRVISEEEYQKMINLLERAKGLVGHPATNISASTNIACENWQNDYEDWDS